MPTTIKRGTDEPLQQWWDTSWSPTNGGNFNAEFKGINLNKMSALANTFAAAGYSGTLRFQHDVATLGISAARTAIPGGGASPFPEYIDKWETAVDQEKPDLTTNPTFLSIVQANDDAGATGSYNLRSVQIIAALKESAANPVLIGSDHVPDNSARGVTPWQSFYSKLQYSYLKNSTGGDTASNLGSGINVLGSQPNLHVFSTDYFEGRTNFLRGKYVLRHQTNAPNNYNTNVADFNVEKIYSIAQLLTECQSTSLWIMPLPSYLAYKITNYPIPAYMRANYMWGALKTRSSAVTAARGRVEIQTEYLIDAIAIHTYGLAS
jgi:hypothetical protein